MAARRVFRTIRRVEKPTGAVRDEHEQLLGHVEHLREAAREVPRLSPEERAAVIERILAFLRGTLIPHAEAEEHVLFPEVARLVGHPEATASMTLEHAAIRARTDALADADPSDVSSLQELLYGLQALITVHFSKEEDIYLPLIDAQPPQLAKEIIERMGERAPAEHSH